MRAPRVSHMEGDLLGGDFGAAAETPRPPQQLGGGGGDPSDPISQLMAMFPTVDRGVVEMVFNDMAGGSIERATESLLQITDDSVDDLAVAATEQAGSDELLALQMLQQMMNEEDMAKADADKVFSKIQHDAEKKEAFKNTPKGAESRAAAQAWLHGFALLRHLALSAGVAAPVRRMRSRFCSRAAAPPIPSPCALHLTSPHLPAAGTAPCPASQECARPLCETSRR